MAHISVVLSTPPTFSNEPLSLQDTPFNFAALAIKCDEVTESKSPTFGKLGVRKCQFKPIKVDSHSERSLSVLVKAALKEASSPLQFPEDLSLKLGALTLSEKKGKEQTNSASKLGVKPTIDRRRPMRQLQIDELFSPFNLQ